ncbi:MAG: trehalose-phosphatase [bacterium]
MGERGLPWALERIPQIEESIDGRRLAFFLDFDGTLAPLAPRPDLARLPARTRDVLASAAQRHLLCVVSGRGLADLREKIGIDSVFYAADHGYRITGPAGSGIGIEIGGEKRGSMRAAALELDSRLRSVPGVLVEAKELTLSVHYRLVADTQRPLVRRTVAEVAGGFPDLRLTEGKLVQELRPSEAWNKGRAMLWLLERMNWGQGDVCPLCVGDDLTDEDMFAAAEDWGVSVIVGHPERPTLACYRLRDSGEAAAFVEALGAAERPGPGPIG